MKVGCQSGQPEVIQSGKYVGVGKMGQIVTREHKQSQGRIHTPHSTSYVVLNVVIV